MSEPCVLVVDDEADLRDLLSIALERMGIRCRTAEHLARAKELVAGERFDLCLTDLRLPDGSGIDLVRHIQSAAPGTPVAVITAFGSMESAIEALKAGAFDFVTKPVDLEALRRLVGTVLRLRPEAPHPDRRSRDVLIGETPAMRELRGMIVKVARSQAPVCIGGESGTGKELVARLVHAKGPRADGPFIAVNCGAIPQDLIESELFGHVKGAFTGAVADKPGLFRAAEGGTLFLDEVADLPLHLQVKLLRVLQEKAVRPVGAHREERVDVRILSATHRDLTRLVREGAFRQDLFYRLNVIEIGIPPLRERAQDIPLLVGKIVERLAQGMERRIPVLDGAALAALARLPFPGNVRELENILERALALCEDDTIGVDDLRLPAADVEPVGPGGVDEGLDEALDATAREAIIEALEATRWNKTRAAERLGITFRALRYRLKKLGIE